MDNMKLKKITQKEFDEFIINENGIKECPIGDYSKISSFAERCSFAEECSFAERCSFAEECSFENGHKAIAPFFIRINNIGSRKDGCLIFNFEDGIYVRSGCWFGTELEFVERVKKVHLGTKHEKEYLLALQLAKIT